MLVPDCWDAPHSSRAQNVKRLGLAPDLVLSATQSMWLPSTNHVVSAETALAFLGELKRAFEVIDEKEPGRPGLITQCCSADKILNAKQQYYVNLIQKINTKVGNSECEYSKAENKRC